MTPASRRIRRSSRALVLALALACDQGGDPLGEIRELQRQGRFAQTVERLRTLVDEDPEHAEANLLLGVALLRTEGAGVAIWPLRKAAEAPEYTVEASLLLARAMLESRTAPDALPVIDRVLELEPDNVPALALRAHAYRGAARNEEALADIERVLELDPNNVAVLVPRVTLLIATERIEEAEEALGIAGEALETTDEHVDLASRARLCIARGLFAFEKGDTEGAEAQYAGCLEQFPTDTLAVTESARFYDRIGQPDRATEILKRAAEASGGGFFRMALARRMGALGDADEEARLLREEALARPSPASWFALADFHVQRDEFDPALVAFEQALAVSRAPEPMLRFAYADTLVQAEQYGKARRVMRHIDAPELRSLILGRIQLGEGNARAALDAFEAGIRLWPNNPAGRFLAGQAAERLGDFDRATSEYRESLRANPAATDAGVELATLYAAHGDQPGALDAAARYVRSHPAKPRAYLVSIRIAHSAGRHGIAAEGLKRLSQLPGQAAVAVAEEASLVAQGRGAALAIEAIERSELDLTDPANAAALRPLLVQLAAQSEHDSARKAVQQALKAHPEEAEFHELHARVLHAAGAAPESAAEAFERAIALDPNQTRAMSGLALLAAEAGDIDAALGFYDRAAEADPEDPAAMLAAAQLALEAQRVKDARRRLEQLLLKHPREAGAANDLALILAEQGELDGAEALARRAAWFKLLRADATLERIEQLRAGAAQTANADDLAAPE